MQITSIDSDTATIHCNDIFSCQFPREWDLHIGDHVKVQSDDAAEFPMCMSGTVYGSSEGFTMLSFGGFVGKIKATLEGDVHLLIRPDIDTDSDVTDMHD